MKVHQLAELLKAADPNAEVLIADNGSIIATAEGQDTTEYNGDVENTAEFFIVAKEW